MYIEKLERQSTVSEEKQQNVLDVCRYVTSDAKTVTVSADNQNEMRFYLYPDSEPVPNLSEMVNEVKQEAKYRATMDPDAFIKQLASKLVGMIESSLSYSLRNQKHLAWFLLIVAEVFD